jgi:predicted ATPase
VANAFSTVFISDVPVMSLNDINKVITLILLRG